MTTTNEQEQFTTEFQNPESVPDKVVQIMHTAAEQFRQDQLACTMAMLAPKPIWMIKEEAGAVAQIVVPYDLLSLALEVYPVSSEEMRADMRRDIDGFSEELPRGWMWWLCITDDGVSVGKMQIKLPNQPPPN